MRVHIRNGNLVISLPLEEPRPSRSGKTLVVASSRGVRRMKQKLDGKTVKWSASAWVATDGPVTAKKLGTKQKPYK